MFQLLDIPSIQPNLHLNPIITSPFLILPFYELKRNHDGIKEVVHTREYHDRRGGR